MLAGTNSAHYAEMDDLAEDFNGISWRISNDADNFGLGIAYKIKEVDAQGKCLNTQFKWTW